jgi:hypothetical protein
MVREIEGSELSEIPLFFVHQSVLMDNFTTGKVKESIPLGVVLKFSLWFK